jgi:predicted nucleotidyltransferase
VLFGSLADGTATPRSDADLLLVVEASDQTEPRDRVPALLGALAPLPCPVDLLVLTRAEVERAELDGSPLVRVALATGIDLV